MKKIFLVFIAFLISFFIFAEKTPVKSLYSYKLENGLSLFVSENHSVPLTYIEIAFRCGSYTQTEENAGLFHLYEHMMFKGNSLYKDAASVNKALSDMGVANWNGSTGLECVNYYFTVPSDMTEMGLEFWNAAIRFPLMDKNEFEAEKKVVISEINGDSNAPEKILRNEKSRLLFSDAPYTMNPGGSEEVVSAATVKQLKNIQKTYYIPNNAAIFVGGDVNPDEIYALVRKIFASWKKGKDPFSKGMIKHNKNPFDKPVYRVMPYDKFSDQLAMVSVDYRGPDAFYDREDTYPVDILSNLIEMPDGFFKSSLVNDSSIGIPDSDYTGGGYQTRKTCGDISFYAMLVQPELDLAERAINYSEKLPLILLETCKKTGEADLKKIRNRLEDDNIIAVQNASGLLSTVRFWWTVCDEEYFYSYNENMSLVNEEKLTAFVNKYIVEKNPLITVLVSPAVYEKTKEDFKNYSFQEIVK